jgi:hypothetical protein
MIVIVLPSSILVTGFSCNNCFVACLLIIFLLYYRFPKIYRYFTSDNEPGGIENATHNTLERKPGHGGDKYPAFPPDVLWVAFSIAPGSLSLVKYPIDCRAIMDLPCKVSIE